MVAGAVDPIWGAPRPRWLHQDMLASLSIVDWGGEAARLARPDETLAGPNSAFRVEALRRHGGFNASLGGKGDGSVMLGAGVAAMTAKVRAAGESVVCVPRARVGYLIPENRLERSWFRRRAAWQAVADFQAKPAWCAQELKRDWPRVARYFGSVPPLQRTLRGLFFDADLPDLFLEQLRVTYLTMLATLYRLRGSGGWLMRPPKPCPGSASKCSSSRRRRRTPGSRQPQAHLRESARA